jgi:hypothetical protein
MTQRLAIVLLYLSQVALLGYELIAHYDTHVRQIALAITNVAVVALYIVVQHVLRKRYGVVVHWVVLLLIVASLWLDAMGNFLHYYAGYWWWDRLTHAAGGLAVTAGFYVVTIALWRAGRMKVSWFVVNVYAFCVGQTLGVVYEITEWLGDMWFNTHRVGGPFDSPRDLFFNMAGGLLALIIGAWWRVRHRAVNGPSNGAH